MTKYLIIIVAILASTIHQVQADTTQAERIYILSAVWQDIRKNFAFPERFKEVNPDSLFRAYIPRVLNAENEEQFSKLMTRFLAHFNEGHTRFNDNNIVRYKVPALFTWVEDKLLVTNSSKKLNLQIPIGSEVKTIDGMPLKEYLQEHIFPYVSAPNNEWKKRKALDFFLTGKKGTDFRVGIITPEGKQKTISLTTSTANIDSITWSIRRDTRLCYVNQLPNDIIYMKMNQFGNPDSIKQTFLQHLPDFLAAKGIIFDIRGNRGGTDESWHPIIQHIANNDINISDGFITSGRVANTSIELYGAGASKFSDFYHGIAMQPIQLSPFKSTLPDSLKITAPIILLTDRFTASAAEDFAVTMKNLKLAKIIGTPTSGVFSSPKFTDFGHGYQALIAACRFTNPDGSDIIYTGIIPDITTNYTQEDALGKTDTALTAAIQLLNK